MRVSEFILPCVLSVAIHALAFSSGGVHHDAEVLFDQGAVSLKIVSSAAPGASHEVPEVNRAGRIEPAPKGAEQSARPGRETMQAVKERQAVPEAEAVAAPEQGSGSTELQDEGHGSGQEPAETTPKVTGRETHMADDQGPGLSMLQKPVQTNPGDEIDAQDRGAHLEAHVVGLSKPEYPWYSRIHAEEGVVVLSVEVLANGKPGRTEVVSSSGYRRLDRAALKAVGSASFVPASSDGRAVTSTKRMAFRFDLDD